MCIRRRCIRHSIAKCREWRRSACNDGWWMIRLLVDDDLKFKSHIAKITSTCCRVLGMLYRSSYFLNKPLLLLLYNTMIQPYLTYCAVVWGSNYYSSLKPLITMQKRAIRLISGVSPRSHTSPLYRELKILKLEDLIKYQILLIMHDSLFGRLPQPVNKFILFDANRPGRRAIHFEESITGSAGTRIPNHRIRNYRQFVVFCRGPSLWNSLISTKIPDIRDIPWSKALFKKCIRILFTDTYWSWSYSIGINQCWYFTVFGSDGAAVISVISLQKHVQLSMVTRCYHNHFLYTSMCILMVRPREALWPLPHILML